MTNKIMKTIMVDAEHSKLCKDYAEEYGLSFSSVVRIAITDFFKKQRRN